MTYEDAELLEGWWIEKARKNFLAFRQYLNPNQLMYNWFVEDICKKLQTFYTQYQQGLKPVLILQAPPQHGKSISVMDAISWFLGLDNRLRIIYASYSETLGIRCNNAQQRTLVSEKYLKIFPNTKIYGRRTKTVANAPRRNAFHFEIIDEKNTITGGQFRNTTVSGSITGETLDIGIIDDAVKGREQANSVITCERIWNWFTDDFTTRFSENAGLIIIMTRWSTIDLIGRYLEQVKKKNNSQNITYKNYQAIATKDEKYRKTGDPLFPELKSLEFLLVNKHMMPSISWESLYQGFPVVEGGNVLKDYWYRWWKVLPRLKYKFITIDTAQKDGKKNDFTDFKAWGVGFFDNCLYLLDHWRGKPDAPTLREQAELFYNKHNTKRVNLTDAVLQGMHIEDKSSGTGLIQELKKKRLKIYIVPRIIDKYLRANDVAPFLKAGYVYLNEDVEDVDNTCKETREFPNSEFDDDLDTLMTAVEVTYINSNAASTLAQALRD